MLPFLRRLRRLATRKAQDRDLRDELAAHLAMDEEERIANGCEPRMARASAIRDFGNALRAQEDTRAAWGWVRVEQLFQDLRAGARIVTRSPGLSAVVVTLVALVVGGNTTIYSMVHTVLSRPAPAITAAGLVTLQEQVNERPSEVAGVSVPDYQDYADALTTVRPLMVTKFEAMVVALADGSYAVRGASVAPNYFDTLGVHLLRGRSFSAAEYQGGADGLVAVIGFRFWQEHFSRDREVLGQTMEINGHAATVVGVAAEGFRGVGLAENAQVWVPLVAYARATGGERAMSNRGRRDAWSIGRLAPGVSLAEARAEARTVSQRLAAEFPRTNHGHSVNLLPYSMTAGGDSLVSIRAPQFLAIFSVITLITLAIVCANVSNLLLSRLVSRQRELAVRLSLGSSRLRLVRLLVGEAMTLSLMACGVACLCVWWVSKTLPGLLNAPVLVDFTPDWRIIGYALALSLVGALTFSIVPAAVVWRQSLLPSIRAGELGASSRRSRLSRGLTILQLACSVLLLTLASLGYRSLTMLSTMDLGFKTDHLLLLRVNSAASAAGASAGATMTETLRQRLALVPAAVGATTASVVPPYATSYVRVRANLTDAPVRAAQNDVGPAFFDVLGVDRLSGREFVAADATGGRAVAVVNQRLAEALWPGQPAVGRLLFLGDGAKPVEVVGIVANALVTGPVSDPRPYFVYLPLNRSAAVGWFYVRHAGGAEAFVSAVRAALKDFDPKIPLDTAVTVQSALHEANDPVRIVTSLLGLFAIGSLTIAGVGLYGVLAFSIRRRSREFGIRMALGASVARVLGDVVREGAMLTGVGLAAGFALSLLVATLARGLLVGVTPTDASTYGAVFALMTVIALVASYLPARRAARVDPVQVLRQD